MKLTISTKHYGLQATLWGLTAAGVYCGMIYGTLAHLEALSGLRPFDMRPSGYSSEQANTLLSTLGPEGREYYLTRQIPLDFVYPALMALTLVSLFKWLETRGINQRLVQIGILLSVGAAVGDYLENTGIIYMIMNWANLSNFSILVASIATIAKSGLVMAATLTVIIGFAVLTVKRIQTYTRSSLYD